jgi:hypothetical protein
MAKENVAQSAAHDGNTSREDLDFGKDAKRVDIALNAVLQANALVRLLMTAKDPGDMVDLVAGVGARLLQLSSIAITALDDHIETTAELSVRMYGRK